MVAFGGILTDRMGAVNAAILFTSLAALGTAFVASARTVGWMMVGRVIVGLGGESLCAAQLALLAHCFGTAEVVLEEPGEAGGVDGGGEGGVLASPPGEADLGSGGRGGGAMAGQGDDAAAQDGAESGLIRREATSRLSAVPHTAAVAPGAVPWHRTFPTTAVAFALQLMFARVGTLCVFLLLPSVYRAAGYGGEWVVVAFTVLSVTTSAVLALLWQYRGWEKTTVVVLGAPRRVRGRRAAGGGLGGDDGGDSAGTRAPVDAVGPPGADSEHPREAHIRAAALGSGDGAEADTEADSEEEEAAAADAAAAAPAAAAAGREAPGRHDHPNDGRDDDVDVTDALLPAESGGPPPGGGPDPLDAPAGAIIRRRRRRRAEQEAESRAGGGPAGKPGPAGGAEPRRGIGAELYKALCVDTARAASRFHGKLALLGVFLVVYSSISVSLVDFATDMFSERWSYSDIKASQTTSIMTAVAIVTTVPMAYLLDVVQRPGVMLLVGALLVLPGHLLLLMARAWPPGIACLLIGLGGSIVSATLWPAISGVIRPSESGTMLGFLLALQNWALCFAPMSVGVVRDATGGYEIVLGTFVALDLVCAMLAVATAVIEIPTSPAPGDAAPGAGPPADGHRGRLPGSRGSARRDGTESLPEHGALAMPGPVEDALPPQLPRSASMDWTPREE